MGSIWSLVIRHPKTYPQEGSTARPMQVHNTQVNQPPSLPMSWETSIPTSRKVLGQLSRWYLGQRLGTQMQSPSRSRLPHHTTPSLSPFLARSFSVDDSLPDSLLWPFGENKEEAGKAQGRRVWKPHLHYWPQRVPQRTSIWGSLSSPVTNLDINLLFPNYLSHT